MEAIKPGGNATKSETRYISGVPLDLIQLGVEKKERIFKSTNPTRPILVDSPGFEDTAGAEVNIANGIGTVRALQEAKKVKVIIVFSEAHTDAKCRALKDLSANLELCVYNLQKELRKPKPAFYALITKMTSNINEIDQFFKRVLTNETERYLKDFIMFFYDENFEIKRLAPITAEDLLIRKNNNENSKKLLTNVIKNSGYITNPEQGISRIYSRVIFNISKRTISNI